MIFASLEIERELPQWAELPGILATWCQDVGIIAVLALLVCGLSYLFERRPGGGQKRSTMWLVLLACAGGAALCYVLFAGVMIFEGGPRAVEVSNDLQKAQSFELTERQALFFTLAGFLAICAVVTPMVPGLVRLRFRRIWAIARLSIKESIRNRVIFVFGLMGLIFLFYGFFVSYKPEDQIRNYVSAIYTPMTILFLVTAALLGSFSIPVDVTRQTIHTIVTKPVEKFEIVLGRFFGHGLLLTVVMLILAPLSLVYVMRGVTAESSRESGTARMAIYGDALRFHGTEKAEKGESVGREWTYRSYIRGRYPGSNLPRQYAIWGFREVPAYLQNRTAPVPFEFTFDIYRTTKGEEDKGVFCDFFIVDGRKSIAEMHAALDGFHKEYNTELDRIRDKWKAKLQTAVGDKKAQLQQEKLNETEQAYEALLAKHGVYSDAKEITDYHTQSLEVPASLFQNFTKVQQEIAANPSQGEQPPVFKVLLTISDRKSDIHSRHQLLGVARRDMYILVGELPFWQNFMKGMIGLWCNTLLILGIAIACSTYFSAVISLLVAMFFLIAGALVEFIRNVALGIEPGGGPFEAANRLFSRLPPSAPLEESTVTAVGANVDLTYRVYLNFVLKFIPDIHRYNLTEYIAEGFDIPWTNALLLDNVLPMLGYLIPWAILAYYLMNSREVANPR